MIRLDPMLDNTTVVLLIALGVFIAISLVWAAAFVLYFWAQVKFRLKHGRWSKTSFWSD